MKRALAILILAAVAVAVFVAIQNRVEPLEAEFTHIEAIDDPAERAGAAAELVEQNLDSDPEVLARAVKLAAESAAEATGDAGAIRTAELLLDLDLPAAPRFAALAALSEALLRAGGTENLDRARSIAEGFTDANDVPNDVHLSLAIRHYVSESLEPAALERLIFSGYARRTDDTAQTWHALIDAAYRRRLSVARETRGTTAALASADSLLAQATDGTVRGILHSMIYHITVDEMPDRALDAAAGLLASTELENAGTMNSVAYDMAERRLEPDLAVRIADRALSFSSSRYDSVNLLDTAGWARFAAGDYTGAAEDLETAFLIQDETPYLGSPIVGHLIDAYRAAGERDAEIDLLALLAARSVADTDAARSMLSAALIERDGSDDDIDAMIAARRYEGVGAAPPLDLPERSGGRFATEEHRGEIILVCFWSYG